MMKRVWRISNLHNYRVIASFSSDTHVTITKPSISGQFVREIASRTPCADGSKSAFPDMLPLFTDKWNIAGTLLEKQFEERVSKLKDEILSQNDDVEKIQEVLKEKGVPLFRIYSDGSAVTELLRQLAHSPILAMEVFNWRRDQLDVSAPMTIMEYAHGISIAGKLNNIDIAVEIYKEACNKLLNGTSKNKINRTPLINSLLGAYSWNGLFVKCISLFKNLKMETGFTPTIVTYNILIRAFGRIMLVDEMEATLREIENLNLTPTFQTYKSLLYGYITAWRWDKMERTYLTMKAGQIKPNKGIHLLMLRGYANSRNLEKMEEIYEMVKEHVDHKEFHLLRSMISAYCRKADVSRVDKVEHLLRQFPDNEFTPWLNVVLICFYAKLDLLEQMENLIIRAFERGVYITTAASLKCIIASYYRTNSVDKLAEFVNRVEYAGWKVCRSLYHCKMTMYGAEMRLSEMEKVLVEMDKVNIPISKKTLTILLLHYERWGQRSKRQQVIGLMCKQGYEVRDTCIS